MILKEKETIGVTMNIDLVSCIPIHDGDIPVKFNLLKDNPTCVNYPDNVCNIFNIEDTPGNMTQISNIDTNA